MRRISVIIFAAILIIALTSSFTVFAQEGGQVSSALGNAFTYQGHLKDGDTPANGSYDFQFKLFDSLSGGSQLGSTLTKQDIPVTDGVFIVTLDFGTAFHGQALWLEVGVRPGDSTSAFTSLSPRQELTATPYALYSLNSWNLTGNAGTNPASNYLGTNDNQPLELRANGQRILRLESHTDSPNMIGGSPSNWVKAGEEGATINGGGSAGGPNRVTDDFGFVGGGVDNQAGDDIDLDPDGKNATVCGGTSNTAGGLESTVAGGYLNQATNWRSTVGGGESNIADGSDATVSGGENNQAIGYDSAIPGGNGNITNGNRSFAAGYRAKTDTDATGSFVWSDSNDFDTWAGGPNQFVARATGGFWMVTGINSSGFFTSGAYLASGSSQWAQLSDRNMKTAFQKIDPKAIAAKVSELPIQSWQYISQSADIRHMGPMAQEFYAAFGLGEDQRYIGTLDADGIALASIKGLYQMNQEQATEIQSLKGRLDRLEYGVVQPTASSLVSYLPWMGMIAMAFALGWMLRAKRVTK